MCGVQCFTCIRDKTGNIYLYTSSDDFFEFIQKDLVSNTEYIKNYFTSKNVS